MRFLIFTVVLVLSQWPSSSYSQDDYCFGKDTEQPQTRHFSSLTAYEIAKGKNMDKLYLVPGCVPQKIWILHRHGTRLPTKRVIEAAPRLEQLRDEIVKNYRSRGNKPSTNPLCTEDFIALLTWKWNSSITSDQAEYLTSQGYEDLRGTAKLYQRYYPTILKKDYVSNDFLFRHSDTQRTKESFKAFAEGIFGPNNNAQAQENPAEDLLLRPYDYCESWKAHDYSGIGSEDYKFKHSQIWNNTLKDISTRLGFGYTLETDDVELMYDICRYEQAWKVDRNSVWCAAFLPDQISVFEYRQDLHYYYKAGYGYDENSRLNCHAVKDMLVNLNSKTGPNAVAYFAHSTGIQTLLTALGINKDSTSLLATGYESMKDRSWMSSYMDPFAANFLAVKYECSADVNEREKVIFFLNQDAVHLDWCNVGLCSWSEVMRRYNEFYQADCASFYCRSAANPTSISLLTLMLAAIVYLIY